MTYEERISRLHNRANELKQKKYRTIAAAAGAISVCLSVFLLFLVMQTDRLTYQVVNSRYTGSSMLSEDAGGYVLVAVIAFAAGVFVTAIMRWYRDRKR